MLVAASVVCVLEEPVCTILEGEPLGTVVMRMLIWGVTNVWDPDRRMVQVLD